MRTEDWVIVAISGGLILWGIYLFMFDERYKL